MWVRGEWVNAPVKSNAFYTSSQAFLLGNGGTVGCVNGLLYRLKTSWTANLPSS